MSETRLKLVPPSGLKVFNAAEFWHEHGDPSDADTKMFEAQYELDPFNGCFQWVGATNGGYAVVMIAGVRRPAASVLFIWKRKAWLEDEYLHNACGNKLCVNPWHHELRPVTERPKPRAARRYPKPTAVKTYTAYINGLEVQVTRYDNPAGEAEFAEARERGTTL